MSKSTVNEDDLSSITSHFFEPGEDVGTFWCRLCIASGTHKGKAYEAPRGRTNLMNHIKTHKNYESEWAAEKSRRDLDPSSTSNKMFVSEISDKAKTMHGWLELTIKNNLPIVTVENVVFRKY